MTPYPPPATSSYPGTVQLPSGMTALSDWLDQSVKAAASPTFGVVTASSKVDTAEVSHAGTIVFDPGSGNWLRFNGAGSGGQWAFISSNGDGFHIDRTDVNDNGTEMEFLTGSSLKWEFGRLGDGTENFILKNQATGVSSFSANGTTGVISLYNPILATPTSGTLTNCTGLPVSTGISGLASGVATFLATPSSANLASALTDKTGSGVNVFAISPTMTDAIINQAANGDTAIKSVRATDTTPTGNFLDFQTAAAASVYKVDRFGALTVNVTAQASTAERLLTFGVSDSGSSFTLDNGTTNAAFFNPTFNGTIEATVEGVPISFFGTKGVDGATNPAILFLYRHNTGGGNTDLSSTVTGVEFRNRATKGFGFTGGHNFQMCGSATLASATASIVSQAGVDNGGNREWQLQPAAGGFIAFGNNKFRRVPTANQDVYDWFPTVNTTDNTVTTLATIPITSGRTYMIEARVAARRTGGSSGTAEDGASYCRRGTYTTKSSTVTLMGSVQTIGTDAEDQAGWDVTMTISSTNVLVRVTGATNNNVTWMGDIKIQSVAS